MTIGELLGYTVISVAVLQWCIAFVNAIVREKLPSENENSQALISILIPARNEERTIGLLLNDLLRQHYSSFEILIFDDESSDLTKEVVQTYANQDSRITLFSSSGLPQGWYGKQHACHYLAQQARGEYFLFLDADVRCTEKFLERCITYVEQRKLDLLSIFPKQEMRTFGEYATVPLMQYILLTLLPLPLVERTKHPLIAAANGQVLLFKASTYKQLAVHERLRSVRAEDIVGARLLKREGKKVSCLVGDDSIRCRMYEHYSDALIGFAKNIVDMFCSSHVCACGIVATTSIGWLFVLTLSSFWIIFYFLCVVSSHVIVGYTARQCALFYGLLAPVHRVHLLLILLLYYGLRSTGSLRWKGRSLF
ncbi:MAG: glycosyltransferase [Bacteroidetes bacterium]|nr:glycosyltransferase [Bacteroidota bacterium]